MLYELLNTKNEYKKVKKTTLASIGWKEKDLETLLSAHINDLISTNELMTIFTERSGQEEPDILALDSKGELYIFELKRWISDKENLLQVLRYGQLYGNSAYEELNELYKKKNPKRDLLTDHKQYFNLEKDVALKTDDFNNKQHFLIVTNGVDQKTIESIMYWKKNGLNIDGIVYWVFEISGKYYIEFNTYSPFDKQLEYDSNCYVLNTNYTNSKKSHEDMIKEKKAAAYCTGWKEKIEKIQKDDIVFLYQTAVGIVAYGKADGKLKKKEWNGIENDEYYMKLNDFVKVTNPMAPSLMKEVADKGFPFRTTMFSIDEESKDKIIEKIRADLL